MDKKSVTKYDNIILPIPYPYYQITKVTPFNTINLICVVLMNQKVHLMYNNVNAFLLFSLPLR